MRVLRDIVVKTGEYQKNGETKARYKNIGKLMQKDGEEPFLILDFDPIWSGTASLYKPKDRNGNETESDELPF